MRPVVLDAGALIAVERRDRFMRAVVAVIVRDRIPAYVPAGVVAQVWRGGRQHQLATLFKSAALRVMPLDDGAARRVGVLLGKAGACDVTDGHVALLAQATGAIVYTSDPDDIGALDPSLPTVTA